MSSRYKNEETATSHNVRRNQLLKIYEEGDEL